MSWEAIIGPRCSFCGKAKKEVLLLVHARSTGAMICDTCVDGMVERVKLYREYKRHMEIER